MAITVTSFERQFLDFADAIKTGREPLVNGEEGLRALEVVLGIYQSCREQRTISFLLAGSVSAQRRYNRSVRPRCLGGFPKVASGYHAATAH